MADLAETATVFAKVSPAQKAAVIDALQSKGHVVGFMGDGINDGPALKAADVGISVDSAVDIAKESADIILLEKSLAVLGDGVIEGRKVFGNITKYIKMGASSNFGNMFSVIGASVFLPFLPMAPIQVLTNNLLYDFSQTDDPHRQRRRGIPGQAAALGHRQHRQVRPDHRADQFDLRLCDICHDAVCVQGMGQALPCFRPGGLWKVLLTQTLIIHIIRTAKIPFLQSRASAAVIATSVSIAIIGIVLPFTFIGTTLGFVALPAGYWIPLLGILLSYAVLTHLMKSWFSRRFGLV